MNFKEAFVAIERRLSEMNEAYHRPVFDEWAVVDLSTKEDRVLQYLGPREHEFEETFARDFQKLRAFSDGGKRTAGQFEFVRDAEGTEIDAFIVLGEGIFLVCNNTDRTVEEIADDVSWSAAQAPFLDLAEGFRQDPLAIP